MISDRRLLFLCRDLSAAVRSGLAIGDSLETMSKGPGPAAGALEGAAREVGEGRALHEALAAQGIFPPVFLSLVRAGEEGGRLPEFLDKLIALLEVRVDFQRRMKRALAYPAFVVLMALAVFLVFSLKVVPLLLEPLQEAGVAPAEEDLWLSRLPGRLAESWPMIAAAALFGAAALTAFFRSRAGRQARALAGHWLPGVRFATEHARLDLLVTTTGLLLETGLPAGAMMEVLGEVFDEDPVISRGLSRASAAVAQGASLSESLGALLPWEDRRSVEVAEKSGRLAQALLALGKSHRDIQQHRLELLATASNVAAVLAVGSTVAVLIWTVLQPVFSVLSNPAALIR